VKLLKAALVRLSGCNQPCFTSDEQFRKANPNTAYSNLSLNMVITLDSRHPMIQRKNNERKNNVASKIHGCQRIADFYPACGLASSTLLQVWSRAARGSFEETYTNQNGVFWIFEIYIPSFTRAAS
jgi:hypothetical protein